MANDFNGPRKMGPQNPEGYYNRKRYLPKTKLSIKKKRTFC